ncbi:MAG: hypothetical protein IJV83_02670 [Clostridia bacterium]|nr:hypothetical protein [Clostridia bacterium]
MTNFIIPSQTTEIVANILSQKFLLPYPVFINFSVKTGGLWGTFFIFRFAAIYRIIVPEFFALILLKNKIKTNFQKTKFFIIFDDFFGTRFGTRNAKILYFKGIQRLRRKVRVPAK